MKKTTLLITLIILASLANAQTSDQNQIKELDQNLNIITQQNHDLQNINSIYETLTKILFFTTVILLLIIGWQRGYLIPHIIAAINRWKAAEIRIYDPKLRQYQTMWNVDPSYLKFLDTRPFIKKLLAPIPEEIFKITLQPNPYVNRETGHTYREFVKGSLEEIDPTERIPRTDTTEDIVNLGMRMFKRGQEDAENGLNRVQILTLIGLIILGILILSVSNTQNNHSTTLNEINQKNDVIITQTKDLNICTPQNQTIAGIVKPPQT